MRVFFLLLSAFFLLPTASAQSQRPEAVVERWVAAQERAARRAEGVRCREESTRRIDSPKGAREIKTVALLYTPSRAPHTDREIEHVEVNGRSVPADEQGRVLRYLRHGRSGAGRISEVMLLAPLVRSMHPQGPPRPDPSVQGSVRVELLGSPESGVDRMTLWFDDRSQRLVQSRMLARHAPDATPLVIDTRYRRVRGLDLPADRTVEGTMQVRRRSRSFTLHYEQILSYECRVVDDR